MLSKNSILRVACPTDNLEAISRMYIEGLGFTLLGEFENHMASMERSSAMSHMLDAGFIKVAPYNRYWAIAGVTFEDIDGYRVVLQNGNWSAETEPV